MTRPQSIPADVPGSAAEPTGWIRRNATTLAALTLIAVAAGWKAAFLGHFYFRQDDFRFFDRALASPLSWGYLMLVDGGHLQPFEAALVWVLARISVYDWTLTAIVTVVLLLAASLAMLRFLRTLFGDRPAILVPLTVGLFTPLTLTSLSFWADTLDFLPLQVALFMAANAHVSYLRSGRTRSAVAAMAWTAAGLASADAGVLVPPLLFALTSAFLLPGGWRQGAVTALRRYRWLWAGYGTLMLAYLVVFAVQLRAAAQGPSTPGPLSGVETFVFEVVRVSFVPGAAGGPWTWSPIGDYAFAAEAPGLVQASWVVAACVFLASLWFRRRARRAWAILAGWITIADIVPVIIGRLGAGSAVYRGLDLHCVADSVSVLVICLGLAFWPAAGEVQPYRAPCRAAVRRTTTVILLGCFLAGSFWSAQAYLDVTSSAPQRSYIATAAAAVRQVRPGTTIISAPVPPDIMQLPDFGPWWQTSVIVGPLVPRGKRLTWVAQPTGVIGNLMMFDNAGRLHPVVVAGASRLAPPGRCWPLGPPGTTVRIPIGGRLYRWTWVARLSYTGPATTLVAAFGGVPDEVAVPSGRHVVYIPVTGGGRAVTLRTAGPAQGACVRAITVGLARPSAGRRAVPGSIVG